VQTLTAAKYGLLTAALVAIAAPSQAKQLPSPHSWGKLDNSYLQYRKDATECSFIANSTPSVAAQDPFVMESAYSVVQPNGRVDGVESVRRFIALYHTKALQHKARVFDQVQQAIDTCLAKRGYKPFRLSKEQYRQLKKLKPGTSERHQYLYQLSVNPAILSTQAI
jgi:hypothetical protein